MQSVTLHILYNAENLEEEKRTTEQPTASCMGLDNSGNGYIVGRSKESGQEQIIPKINLCDCWELTQLDGRQAGNKASQPADV